MLPPPLNYPMQAHDGFLQDVQAWGALSHCSLVEQDQWTQDRQVSTNLKEKRVWFEVVITLLRSMELCACWDGFVPEVHNALKPLRPKHSKTLSDTNNQRSPFLHCQRTWSVHSHPKSLLTLKLLELTQEVAMPSTILSRLVWSCSRSWDFSWSEM